jgi:non-specific serine/threonine protein kinase
MEALGDLRSVAIAQTILAAVLIWNGDLEAATRTLSASFAGHAHLGDPWFMSLNLLILVRLQMDLRQWAAAARMLGAAQAIGERVSSVHDDTYNYEGLGASIGAHLNPDRFTALWTAGYALSFHQAATEAIGLASSTSTEPRRAPSPAPETEPLTRRERQVAAFLAHGETDRQIADALSISVGTVSVHVHRILQKLGLYSRQQVAEWLAAEELHTRTRR